MRKITSYPDLMTEMLLGNFSRFRPYELAYAPQYGGYTLVMRVLKVVMFF